MKSEEIDPGIIFFSFSVTITLSVILGMFGMMFCVLIGWVYRRYRRNRNSNRRKLKNSDENLCEENPCFDNDQHSEEEEIFNIRLHNLQTSIMPSVSPEECDINIIQDPTISSTSSERFSLWLFFRNLLK